MRTAHEFAAYLNGYDTGDGPTPTWEHAEAQPEYDAAATVRLDPLAMRWLFATKDRHVIEWTGDKWAVTGHLDDYYKDDE